MGEGKVRPRAPREGLAKAVVAGTAQRCICRPGRRSSAAQACPWASARVAHLFVAYGRSLASSIAPARFPCGAAPPAGPATGVPVPAGGTLSGQVVSAVGGPHRQAFVAGGKHEKHPVFDKDQKVIGYTSVYTSVKATPNAATYHPAL